MTWSLAAGPGAYLSEHTDASGMWTAGTMIVGKKVWVFKFKRQGNADWVMIPVIMKQGFVLYVCGFCQVLGF